MTPRHLSKSPSIDTTQYWLWNVAKTVAVQTSDMSTKYFISRNRFIISRAPHILIKRDFSANIRCQSSGILAANKWAALTSFPSSFSHGRMGFATAVTAESIQQKRESKYHEMEKNLKYREDPVIMTLDTPQFKSLLTANRMKLYDLFQKHNYEIRFCGGVVRYEISQFPQNIALLIFFGMRPD